MITLLHGKGVGSGKSYYLATQLLFRHFCNGGTAFVSDSVGLDWNETKAQAAKAGYELQDAQFVQFDTEEANHLHKRVFQGTPELPVLLVLDEAQGPLNARDWADASKRGFFAWLCQSRHDDVDVWISTQHLDNVDKQIRRIVTSIHTTQDMAQVRFLGFIRYRENCFRHAVWTPDYKQQVSCEYIPKKKSNYRLYNTRAMRGKHRETSQQAERVETKKKTKMQLGKFILILLLVIAAVVGYAYQKAKSYAAPKLEKQNSAPQTTTAKAAPEAPKFRISTDLRGRPPVPRLPVVKTEILKGTDSQSFLRTEEGTYTLGQMGVHGVCMAIKNRLALVKALDGSITMIVAVDKVGSTAQDLPQTQTTTKTNQTTQTK